MPRNLILVLLLQIKNKSCVLDGLKVIDTVLNTPHVSGNYQDLSVMVSTAIFYVAK